MRRLLISLLLIAAPALAQQKPGIAVIGLIHSHVWGHLGRMVEGESARLTGIAENNPELIAEARKLGAPDSAFYSDPAKMLDETKPRIVWAFVENNRHLDIVKMCAPRKIHVIFEKPLASSHDNALEIRRLAKKHGIHVMTNYQMAWWPSNHVAKAQAATGEIGKPWRLRGIVGHGGPGNTSPRNKYFFEWLTDPVKNGAGALIDFQCYNAVWSLMYLGKPEKVYAHVNHLRPETFPKVEDNSAMVLSYKDGVGLFEGSWDLPRSFQDLEIFGLKGSLYVNRQGVEQRIGRKGPARQLRLDPLPPEKAEPIAYMVNCIKTKTAPEGMVALDINVDVVEIMDAAKRSVVSGASISLPLKK